MYIAEMRFILLLPFFLTHLYSTAQDCNTLVVKVNGNKYGKELQLFYPMTTDQGEIVYVIQPAMINGILYISGDDYRWRRNHPKEAAPTGKRRYYVFKFYDNTEEYVYAPAKKAFCKNKDFCVQLTGKAGDKNLLKKMISETLSDIRVYEGVWTKEEMKAPVNEVIFMQNDADVFKQMLSCINSK